MIRKWVRQAQPGAFKSERTIRIIFTTWIILNTVLALSGCNREINCDGYFLSEYGYEYPTFIDRVWPAPGGEFSLDCYQYLLDGINYSDKGVGLTFTPFWIDTNPMDASNPPITPRIELFVDEELFREICYRLLWQIKY